MIARRLAERMEGHLWIEGQESSGDGRMSCLFRLPVAVEDSTSPSAPSYASSYGTASGYGSKAWDAEAKEARITAEARRLETVRVGVHTAANVVRQPEGGYAAIRLMGGAMLEGIEAEALEIRLKYEGYLARQEKLVARTLELEDRTLPTSLWDSSLRGVSHEAAEKLRTVRPRTVGQAGRVPGVSPADVTVLLILLRGAGVGAPVGVAS
jgi:hypothetical protein